MSNNVELESSCDDNRAMSEEEYYPLTRNVARRATFVDVLIMIVLTVNAIAMIGVILLGIAYWKKVGVFMTDVAPMVPEITDMLSQAQDDMEKFTQIAVYFMQNEGVISDFLSKLPILDEAAQCTLSTMNCSQLLL